MRSFLSAGSGRGGRGGDEGQARTRGGYLHKTRRNRGKNEVRPRACPLGFRFPGADPLVSRWSGSPEEVQAANNAIVNKLADLCGRAHPEQFSAACYALSQSGAGANVRSAFTTHNISSSEHMPLTFAITRSNETGAIEIVCSEPAGFPLRFRWTITVAIDGTVTSTPMMIEQPPQQPQLQPVANP